MLKRKNVFIKCIKTTAFILLFVAIGAILIFLRQGRLIAVRGASMMPTLHSGDILFVKDKKEDVLEKGAVYVLRDHAGKTVVKRVAYIPGDTVEGTHTLLAPQEYYVLGDNSSVSIDSRSYGVVNYEQFDYKLQLRIPNYVVSLYSAALVALGAIIFLYDAPPTTKKKKHKTA